MIKRKKIHPSILAILGRKTPEFFDDGSKAMANWSPGMEACWATRVSAQDDLQGVQSDYLSCEHVQFCEAFTDLLGHLGLGVILVNDYSRIESTISKKENYKKLPTSTIGGCQVVPSAQSLHTGQSRTMVY